MYEQTKARLEVLNLRFDLLLKVVVIGLIVLIVIFRATVLDMLADAGVKTLKLPFLEVEIPAASAEEAKGKLEDILNQVTEQKQRNASLVELVRCANAQTCSSEQATEIAALTGVSEAEQPEDPVVASLQRAVIQADQLIKTRGLATVAPVDEWVVVVGADKTMDSAEYELRRLEEAGFNARVVRKGTWLRTLASFSSQEAAAEAEAELAKLMGRQVFVLNYGSWCRDPKTDETTMIVCS